MSQPRASFRLWERFREVRRLALPTVALFVVGSFGAWLARQAVVVWLLLQTGDLTEAPPSHERAPDGALLDLALGVGFVLVTPLLAWQVAALIAPASIHAARRRFAAYLALSFVVVGGDLLHYLAWTAEGARALVEFEQQFEHGMHFGDQSLNMLQSVEPYVSSLCVWALYAAAVVPIHAAVRHHSAEAHPARATAVAAWSLGGLVMIGLRRLDDTHPARVSVRGFVVAGAVLAVLFPLLSSWLYRALTGKGPAVLPVLGLIGLLLAFGALVFSSNDEAVRLWMLYPAAAGSAVGARWLRGEARTP